MDRFFVGHGGADAVARPIVESGYAPETVLKGVRVRAATANTIVIYVGPAGVAVDSGYPLPAGEELEVQVSDVSKVHVIATPAGNTEQVVTIAGDIAGETFTLTLDGHTTAPIAVDAAAGDVEDALEVLPNIGAGNVSVSGDAGGPFTVEFIGDLAKTDMSLLVGSDGGINERQTVAIVGAAAGDKLVLTYDGQSTAELAYDATSAQVAAALKLLSNIGGCGRGGDGRRPGRLGGRVHRRVAEDRRGGHHRRLWKEREADDCAHRCRGGRLVDVDLRR